MASLGTRASFQHVALPSSASWQAGPSPLHCGYAASLRALPSGDCDPSRKALTAKEGFLYSSLVQEEIFFKEIPSTPAFLAHWLDPGHVATSYPITGKEGGD